MNSHECFQASGRRKWPVHGCCPSSHQALGISQLLLQLPEVPDSYSCRAGGRESAAQSNQTGC